MTMLSDPRTHALEMVAYYSSKADTAVGAGSFNTAAVYANLTKAWAIAFAGV